MNLTLEGIVSALNLKNYPPHFLMNIEKKGNMIVLHHYGDDGNSGYLEPSKFGSRSYTLGTKKNWDKPRVFFYIKPSDKEHMVYGRHYIAHYPLNKLYYFHTDVNNYYDDCLEDYSKLFPYRDSLSLRQQMSCIGEKAKKNGYGGLIFEWGRTYRIDIWEKVPVQLATT